MRLMRADTFCSLHLPAFTQTCDHKPSSLRAKQILLRRAPDAVLILKKMLQLSAYLEYLVKVTIILSMGGIVVIVNIAVFYRYVLSDPLTWTTEISSYLLVYTVLFGAAIGLRHNQFVKVEALSNLLSKRLRLAIILITQILIALFLVVCIGSPSVLIQKAILTKTTSPALGIPMANLYHLLRIGFVCMLLFFCFGTIELLGGSGNSDSDRGKAK